MVLVGGLVSLGCTSNPSTSVAARGQPPPLVSGPTPIAAGLSDTELAKRFGPAVYRGDIRSNYMTVMRVLPMKAKE